MKINSDDSLSQHISARLKRKRYLNKMVTIVWLREWDIQ